MREVSEPRSRYSKEIEGHCQNILVLLMTLDGHDWEFGNTTANGSTARIGITRQKITIDVVEPSFA